MVKARQADFFKGPFMGGFTFYPYQVAVGVSLRYWPCLYAPSIRIHIGPFKVWFGMKLRPAKQSFVKTNANGVRMVDPFDIIQSAAGQEGLVKSKALFERETQ